MQGVALRGAASVIRVQIGGPRDGPTATPRSQKPFGSGFGLHMAVMQK